MRPDIAMVTFLVVTVRGVWISDIFSDKGWHFGDDMVFHIEDSKAKNVSFFDRLAFRIKYGDYEVNAMQIPDNNAVQLDLYSKDNAEGRAKKMGTSMIPFAVGAIKAAIATMFYAAVKFLVLKSLMVAKAALLFSLLLLLVKLHKKSDHGTTYLEVEQHGSEPYYSSGYGHSGYGASGGGYSYGASGAESSLSYATAPAPGANDSSASLHHQHVVSAASGGKQQQVVRRKDTKRRPAILTITRYSKPDSGLL